MAEIEVNCVIPGVSDQIRWDGFHLVATVTIKIHNAGQSNESRHGARTTAGTLVVSFMANEY
jgi:hypothetical protein